MSDEQIRQWVMDHCYDADDIVLGDAGLTEKQLPDLHALLDAVAPNWRDWPLDTTTEGTVQDHPPQL